MNRRFNQVPIFQQTTRLHSDNYSEIGMYIKEYQVTIYENEWRVAQFNSPLLYTQESFEKEFANRESFTQNINMRRVLHLAEMNIPEFNNVLLEAIYRANSVSTSDSPREHIIGVLQFVKENEDGSYSLDNLLPF
jgi:hypothetical protein